MKILRIGTWLALGLALLIVGLDSPPAGAESASLRIPAKAFHPQSSSVGFAPYGGVGMYATSNPDVEWTAPLYLPQGAVVNSMRMFYIDNNTTYSCVGDFVRYDFATNLSQSTGIVSSGNSSSVAYVDVLLNYPIDYSKYAYALKWHPSVADSSMVLVGFQIFYTPPPGRVAVIPLY